MTSSPEALSHLPRTLIDPPGQFSPPKHLQAFLDQWEGKPEAKEPGLALQLRQTRDALAMQEKAASSNRGG